jgi:hypothetical protein
VSYSSSQLVMANNIFLTSAACAAKTWMDV